jgi:hypothetical protein
LPSCGQVSEHAQEIVIHREQLRIAGVLHREHGLDRKLLDALVEGLRCDPIGEGDDADRRPARAAPPW